MSLVQTTAMELTADVSDSVTVWNRFLSAVNDLPGVTVVGSLKHDFPGGGFSGLVMLAESHAAIHTWPEHRRAWVELATCGDPIALKAFELRMLGGWNPD